MYINKKKNKNNKISSIRKQCLDCIVQKTKLNFSFSENLYLIYSQDIKAYAYMN